MQHVLSDITTAHQVVTDPARFFDQPMVLAGAWLTLMQARGNATALHRLGPPAHLVVTAEERIAARYDRQSLMRHSARQNVPCRAHRDQSGGDVA